MGKSDEDKAAFLNIYLNREISTGISDFGLEYTEIKSDKGKVFSVLIWNIADRYMVKDIASQVKGFILFSSAKKLEKGEDDKYDHKLIKRLKNEFDIKEDKPICMIVNTNGENCSYPEADVLEYFKLKFIQIKVTNLGSKNNNELEELRNFVNNFITKRIAEGYITFNENKDLDNPIFTIKKLLPVKRNKEENSFTKMTNNKCKHCNNCVIF